MNKMKLDASTGMKGWDDKPFFVPDPAKVCATCRYAAKMRSGPADIMGQVICLWGPKHLTSLPGPGGVVGFSGHPAVRPDETCFQWQAPDATDAPQTAGLIAN